MHLENTELENSILKFVRALHCVATDFCTRWRKNICAAVLLFASLTVE